MLLAVLLIASPAVAGSVKSRPAGRFVSCGAAIPEVRVDLRYGGTNNFVGERIDGYRRPVCLLTGEAAMALAAVQKELRPLGLGLKIYDAYRPQRAVDHFVRWASDTDDVRMKAEFYPRVDKKDLFRDDYISARSGHSRGSTVDLTIVSLEGNANGEELDMGTGFDLFGPESSSDWPGLTQLQRDNRLLLQRVMKMHGFRPYAREWWHFTLAGEPYPDTYFDFPLE